MDFAGKENLQEWRFVDQCIRITPSVLNYLGIAKVQLSAKYLQELSRNENVKFSGIRNVPCWVDIR